MSDHWNSLANLLGTPSLSPQKPKSESSPSHELAPNLVAQPNPPIEALPEKSKGEKSRIKTSWDAVASFFGVATKDVESLETEPVDANSPPPAVSHIVEESTAKSSPPRRGKPSMWLDQKDQTDQDSPKEPSTQGNPARVSQSDSARSLAPRVTEKREPVARERSRPGSEDEPQRRSHRRPPRRGRDIADETSPPPREERPQKRRSETRTDRPTVAIHSEAPPEPAKEKKASGFGFGIDNPNIDSLDDRVDPLHATGDEGHEQDRLRTSPEELDERNRRRRRRGGRGRKREDIQHTVKDRDEESDREVADREDREVLATRRSRTSEEREISEDDEAPTIRQAKIPSWTETIGVLVEANMLNHQRSQGSHRGNPRGRGRR